MLTLGRVLEGELMFGVGKLVNPVVVLLPFKGEETGSATELVKSET